MIRRRYADGGIASYARENPRGWEDQPPLPPVEPTGEARSRPSLGQALSQAGTNFMNFNDKFWSHDAPGLAIPGYSSLGDAYDKIADPEHPITRSGQDLAGGLTSAARGIGEMALVPMLGKGARMQQEEGMNPWGKAVPSFWSTMGPTGVGGGPAMHGIAPARELIPGVEPAPPAPQSDHDRIWDAIDALRGTKSSPDARQAELEQELELMKLERTTKQAAANDMFKDYMRNGATARPGSPEYSKYFEPRQPRITDDVANPGEMQDYRARALNLRADEDPNLAAAMRRFNSDDDIPDPSQMHADGGRVVPDYAAGLRAALGSKPRISDTLSMRNMPNGFAHGGAPVEPATFNAPAPVMPNPSVPHVGALKSLDGGRTDTLPISVKSGSYVLPADIVSALGEGNSDAGQKAIHSLFYGPYGIKPGGKASSRIGPSTRHFAAGGAPAGLPGSPPGAPIGMPTPGAAQVGDNGAPVDIMAAGGEHVLPPEVAKAVGGGDIEHGHKVLDSFVKKVRKHHIKTLSKLPNPAK